MTCFIVIVALTRWSGTKACLSPGCACVREDPPGKQKINIYIHTHTRGEREQLVDLKVLADLTLGVGTPELCREDWQSVAPDKQLLQPEPSLEEKSALLGEPQSFLLVSSTA